MHNQDRAVDGAGSGLCDVCHGHVDHSWAVTKGGKRSLRCTTHLDEKFDRAAVWR